jgi:hypothetical protein
MVHADDVNLLGENIDIIQKNTVLLDARKKVGLGVSVMKTKLACILMSHH